MAGSDHRSARYWITRVVFTVVMVCTASLEALDFDRLSLEQGLSQSIIEAIAQDHQGYMWFATEDGLNRFDGYTFTVFKNVPGDLGSLSHNELETLHVGRDGVLWVGAFANGLNRFDPATERVTRFRHDPDNPGSLGGHTVRCVLEDSAGRLWVGTQGNGLDRLDPATGTFMHYRFNNEDPSSLSHDDVRALFEDSNGTLWVGTFGGGLNRLDPETGGFVHFRHDPEDWKSLSHDHVTAILEDLRGGLWIGTAGGGLNLLDPDSTHCQRHRADDLDPDALSSDVVTSMAEDHNGVLWVGTDGGGLNRYDRATNAFISYRNDPVDQRSLSTDRVYAVFEDRSHVLWVGTYGGGLCTFDVGRKRFRHIRTDPDDPTSLSHDIVWSFARSDDGALWVGTDSGGLNRRHPRTGRWQHFTHSPDDQRSLAHNTVRAVLVDSRGALWVATNGGGLDCLDPATGTIRHHRHSQTDPGSLSHDQLRSVFEDRSGVLWVSTFGGGLDRFDPSTGSFTNFRHHPDDPSSLSNDFLRLVYQDREGTLWVGTQGGGLNRFDPASGRFTRFRHDSGDSLSLSNDHVFAILEAENGEMWIGTFGGGLNHFDRATNTFSCFTVADGLPSDSIYAMLEDEAGGLWISTTRGLSRFDPGSGSFRNFDLRDGLQSNEFNGGAAFQAPDGEMYFGGINGFNSFYPSEIGVNTVVPNVVLTDLEIFNRSLRPGEEIDGRVILERSVAYADEVVLSHRDTVFTLEFAALHFSAPEKNLYAYRMEGFSDEWIPVSSARRSATFTGLAPGEYVFRVRGANSDGVWNLEGASLRIRVTPPFWATWWFRAAAALLAVLLALAALRTHLRGVRMKTQLIAAHDAQMLIMPQRDPELEGFDISGVCIPADEVGGDFFDYFRPEGESRRLCVAVGDVAGKGMRAAMTAVMSDGMIFSRARQGGSLEQIMCSLNRSLDLKVGERMFAALCLAVLDPDSGEMTFVNAGQCEPLHKTSDGAVFLSSPGPRFPLGAMRSVSYESRKIRLAPGDVVVIFTDGIPEARDGSGNLYGYEAPQKMLEGLNTAGLHANQIKQAIVDGVRAFSGRSRQQDDIALVVIKALR